MYYVNITLKGYVMFIVISTEACFSSGLLREGGNLGFVHFLVHLHFL